MRLPTMPDGWWLAYIYPLSASGTWLVDARSMTASAKGENADLSVAIAEAITNIEMGITEADDRPAPNLLAELGLNEPTEPIKRRKL